MTDPNAQEGALQELARDDSSRKRFFKMMGGAGARSFKESVGGKDA